VIVTLKEVVIGTHWEIEPSIVRVKVPVEVTLDQSNSLVKGEKVTPVGEETVASRYTIMYSAPVGEVVKAGTV
jgi:hypothetical protein